MDRKEVYKEFKKKTNMSYGELLAWSKNPCSKKASLSRAPLKRNLRLLKKPFSRWNEKDFADSKRNINYVNRSGGIKKGKEVRNCGLSKNEIARRNWARNDVKSVPIRASRNGRNRKYKRRKRKR